MTDLKKVADASFGGIAAFYSIVNIPPEAIPKVFGEMRRILKSGGVLLVSFHIGQETIHLEEILDKTVALDFFFYETADIKKQLIEAGFEIEEAIEPDPYRETVEHQSRRAYIFARNKI